MQELFRAEDIPYGALQPSSWRSSEQHMFRLGRWQLTTTAASSTAPCFARVWAACNAEPSLTYDDCCMSNNLDLASHAQIGSTPSRHGRGHAGA